MEAIEIEVTGRKSLVLPYDEIQLMPIGDVQLGADGVSEDKLKRHIEWGLSQGNTYFIGMGDYVDVMSPSNRAMWRSSKVYDSVRSAMTDKSEELVERFLKIVAGTEERWIGLLEGHHYYEFEDGTTSDTRIAKELKAPYLGTCGFIRLIFRSGEASLKCTVWAHHGAGSGVASYSSLAKLFQIMHNFSADIYLMGHQTKKPVVKIPVISMSDRAPFKLNAKHKLLVGTGGWMAGYTFGTKDPTRSRKQGGYVEQKLLSPSALGGPLIKIRPVHGDNKRLDLNVEI